ncbi:5068_t:CDS:2 [Dentiscutata heterogama]|uniref:5068_t:CDS:1 n=1 Tax=Dentiscutata heterogama TaxID=1316150 RepID=A0ACA9LR23_9GLOM|nr:5068_t:CDS:2 [Dentiscutata heterogama]
MSKYQQSKYYLKQETEEKHRRQENESWSLWIEDMIIENHRIDILKEEEYKFRQSIQKTPIKDDKIKIINDFTNEIYEISKEDSDINNDINEIVKNIEENSNSEIDKNTEKNSNTSELEIINKREIDNKNLINYNKINSIYDYNYFNFIDFNDNVINSTLDNNLFYEYFNFDNILK